MAKKKKAAKLPKRIAGVRISKVLRRGAIADFVASPFGQDLFAEILYHAGVGVMRRVGDSDAMYDAERGLRRASRRTSNLAAGAASAAVGGASAVAHAISVAAHAFVDTLRNARHDVESDQLAEDNEEEMQAPMPARRRGKAASTRLADELREEEDRDLRH
jgi:hypothetical protein